MTATINELPSIARVTQKSYFTPVKAFLYAVLGIVSFHSAYSLKGASFLIAVYLYCLFQLAEVKTNRQAFYGGLLIGLAIYVPQLNFFWSIFGPAGAVLWLVVAIWLGFFLLLSRLSLQHFGPSIAAFLIPFLWTGLEYFRSELYYLRFSWLNAGYAFSDSLQVAQCMTLGCYGAGFIMMLAIALISMLPWKPRWIANGFLLAFIGLFTQMPFRQETTSMVGTMHLPIAGIQMEFPMAIEIPIQLDKLIRAYPEAKLVVLSEYTFDGPVPERVNAWCRKNQRYLIAGGKDYVSPSQFYNTIFVIDPQGKIVFRQAKCVPIQFFKDGLPAKEQQLWQSPWGKLGLCICYDLSYRKITDQLIRLGAQALIVPTMDVTEWGGQEHRLHALVAPIRAAEYRVPVFRVASSGISQLVDGFGQVKATAPHPGENAMIAGSLSLARSGIIPLDRFISPLSVAVVISLLVFLMAKTVIKNKHIRVSC